MGRYIAHRRRRSAFRNAFRKGATHKLLKLMQYDAIAYRGNGYEPGRLFSVLYSQVFRIGAESKRIRLTLV